MFLTQKPYLTLDTTILGGVAAKVAAETFIIDNTSGDIHIVALLVLFVGVAMLGFALTEAVGLLALMMAFLILFS